MYGSLITGYLNP